MPVQPICSEITVKNTQKRPANDLVNILASIPKISAPPFSASEILPIFLTITNDMKIATAGGMVFMIDWRIALILLAIFAIIVLITKYVSLGSIAMAVFYPVFIFVFYKSVPLVFLSMVFTLIVVLAHRENIKKLINHTESKIGSKKENN